MRKIEKRSTIQYIYIKLLILQVMEVFTLLYDSAMQIIALSASANKLSKIQDRSEEYAALIMEELDPDNLGFIEVNILFIINSKTNKVQL